MRTNIFVHSSFSSNTKLLGLQVWPLCCCSVEGDCDCICQWAITDGKSPIWIITLLARVKCYIHYHFQFPLPVFNLFFMAAPSWKTLQVVFWTLPIPVFKLQSFLPYSSFLKNTWKGLLTASPRKTFEGVFWSASSRGCSISTALLERHLKTSSRYLLEERLKVSSDGVFTTSLYSSGIWQWWCPLRHVLLWLHAF